MDAPCVPVFCGPFLRCSSFAYCIRKALIQSTLTSKSPGPDFVPGTPPSALTDRDMPTIRAGFIYILAFIMFPLHVGA
ncbi:hypothetical protein FXO38_36327 [Capsicum annuum]|nr:hypothetical protein FXO38_36327 [Capsicum annuum]